jgi:ATPase components of ABC transporters with duplicated ATPase domains
VLLDEPTNHLDIDMREALTEALQDYTGALIVVAHDRHLLRATADELWLVADGALALFDGDLDDYRQWVLAGRGREAATTVTDAASLAPDRKSQKRAEAATRQRLSELRKPLQQKIERIEQRIDLLSTEKRGLDEWPHLRGLHRREQGAADRFARAARRSGLGARARRSRMARAARSARARSRLKARFALRPRYALTGTGVSAPGVGAFHGATRNKSAMPGSASAMHKR